MKKCLLVILSVALVISSINAKTFTKCSLAKELTGLGFARNTLPDWVCLAQAESSFRTHKVGGPNKNKSKDYGLFQINDKYWCAHGSKGKDCNVECDSLLTDDITEAAKCAQKVFKRHGYRAWYGWRNKCDGKTLPSVDDCF